MDRLDAMRLFVTAVEAGSLAAAGRRHGHSPAAVTRAVAMLEAQAGETLLLRSTRRLSLTPIGEAHLAAYAGVLGALDGLAHDAAGQAIEGAVSLTAPELFGRLAVMPRLDGFLRAHDGVRLRVLLQNRVVNLVGEGVDIAVRLSPLRDSELRSVRVGTVRTLLCAAPAYLDARGAPGSPADLARHDCIGLNGDGGGELWSFVKPGGRRRSVRISPRLAVDHAAASIEAALRGQGIVQARSYQVADAIAAGTLVRLLPGDEEETTPAHLLFPPQQAGRAAVRALVDHLAPALRAHLQDVEAALESTPDR